MSHTSADKATKIEKKERERKKSISTQQALWPPFLQAQRADCRHSSQLELFSVSLFSVVLYRMNMV